MRRPGEWKVGVLARRTGISVRSLHHYDQIGLLAPSHRTESGHRLYTAGDLGRLQQVVLLRSLDFSLEEIRLMLDRGSITPLQVVETHIATVQHQIAAQQRIYERLQALARGLRTADEVSVEILTHTLEVTAMIEKYYTPEQPPELRQRRELLGEERIKAVEAEWPALQAQVREAMDSGADPAGEAVQVLARRWQALVREFTGGNPGIERSLRTLYEQETGKENPYLDPRAREYGAYIAQALAAASPEQE